MMAEFDSLSHIPYCWCFRNLENHHLLDGHKMCRKEWDFHSPTSTAGSPQISEPSTVLSMWTKKNFEISKALWIFLPSSWIFSFLTPQKKHLSKLPPQNHFCPEIYVSPPFKKSGDHPTRRKKKHDKKPETILLLTEVPRCIPFAVRLPEAWPHAFLAGVERVERKVGEGSFNHHDGVILRNLQQDPVNGPLNLSI